MSTLQRSVSRTWAGVYGCPKSALAAGRSPLGLCKPHRICSNCLPHPFAQHPAPKGSGSTHVQTPRSMTDVFLPEERPRDCQPAPHHQALTAHTPVPPPYACDATCSAGNVALPPARAQQQPQEQSPASERGIGAALRAAGAAAGAVTRRTAGPSSYKDGLGPESQGTGT